MSVPPGLPWPGSSPCPWQRLPPPQPFQLRTVRNAMLPTCRPAPTPTSTPTTLPTPTGRSRSSTPSSASPPAMRRGISSPSRTPASPAQDRCAGWSSPTCRPSPGPARRAGAPLRVESAYRSYRTQVGTFAGWVRASGRSAALRASARPGHSEHQLGTAIDFSSGRRAPCFIYDWATTRAGAWMAGNAWRERSRQVVPEGRDEPHLLPVRAVALPLRWTRCRRGHPFRRCDDPRVALGATVGCDCACPAAPSPIALTVRAAGTRRR